MPARSRTAGGTGLWMSVQRAAWATVHLVVSAAMAFGMWIFITVLEITAIGVVAVVGVWLLPETVLIIRRIAGAKRSLTARWTGVKIPEAYQPITGTMRQRIVTAVRDPGTLVDMRWMVAYWFYGALLGLALPLWPVGLVVDGVRCGLLRRGPVVLPLIVRIADLEADWSTALLKPSPKAQLAARVEELAATRADAISAHGAELRRIERDLHDGAQAQLVALSMRIGLAKRAYGRDHDTALRLLDEAQEQAEKALTELRQVVRGIHPPILSDRGLVGAVRALAASSGLGVTVEDDGLEDGVRAPAAVETAAYFVVAEALTNVAKYSGVSRAEVRLVRFRRGLRIRVRDEGLGGADEAGGSGLLGMRRRVAALDGSMEVSSPVGGPTVIEAELPCVW
ncbi:sensor histidine kinase [Streptomyces sp. CA-249302]|uniref:sensor histidine kinase n=1 Tax=Streptomyces sp. CA-249302 TaxID=3240058 RepID=UPI003D8AB736